MSEENPFELPATDDPAVLKEAYQKLYAHALAVFTRVVEVDDEMAAMRDQHMAHLKQITEEAEQRVELHRTEARRYVFLRRVKVRVPAWKVYASEKLLDHEIDTRLDEWQKQQERRGSINGYAH